LHQVGRTISRSSWGIPSRSGFFLFSLCEGVQPMFHLLRSRLTTGVGLAAVLTAAIAVAQNPAVAPRPAAPAPQPGQQQGVAPQQGYGQQAAMHTDAQLAFCLSIDNQNEIALAEIAQQRSKSDDVKQFAQTLMKDH